MTRDEYEAMQRARLRAARIAAHERGDTRRKTVPIGYADKPAGVIRSTGRARERAARNG